MKRILQELRSTPIFWLLVLAPVLVAEHLAPKGHTLLFLLSVAAIVPLAALLSRATESVTAKTGDAIGGLLNATLGNLTELVSSGTRQSRRAASRRSTTSRRGAWWRGWDRAGPRPSSA